MCQNIIHYFKHYIVDLELDDLRNNLEDYFSHKKKQNSFSDDFISKIGTDCIFQNFDKILEMSLKKREFQPVTCFRSLYEQDMLVFQKF